MKRVPIAGLVGLALAAASACAMATPTFFFGLDTNTATSTANSQAAEVAAAAAEESTTLQASYSYSYLWFSADSDQYVTYSGSFMRTYYAELVGGSASLYIPVNAGAEEPTNPYGGDVSYVSTPLPASY